MNHKASNEHLEIPKTTFFVRFVEALNLCKKNVVPIVILGIAIGTVYALSLTYSKFIEYRVVHEYGVDIGIWSTYKDLHKDLLSSKEDTVAFYDFLDDYDTEENSRRTEKLFSSIRDAIEDRTIIVQIIFELILIVAIAFTCIVFIVMVIKKEHQLPKLLKEIKKYSWPLIKTMFFSVIFSAFWLPFGLLFVFNEILLEFVLFITYLYLTLRFYPLFFAACYSVSLDREDPLTAARNAAKKLKGKMLKFIANYLLASILIALLWIIPTMIVIVALVFIFEQIPNIFGGLIMIPVMVLIMFVYAFLCAFGILCCQELIDGKYLPSKHKSIVPDEQYSPEAKKQINKSGRAFIVFGVLSLIISIAFIPFVMEGLGAEEGLSYSLLIGSIINACLLILAGWFVLRGSTVYIKRWLWAVFLLSFLNTGAAWFSGRAGWLSLIIIYYAIKALNALERKGGNS